METGLYLNTVSRGRLAQFITWVTGTLAGSKKGIKDVIVSMIPQVVSLGTGLFTSILVARGLGPGGLGEYALVLSVSDMTTTLSDLGIGQTALRYASRAAGLRDPDGQMGVLRWAFRRRVSLVILISVIAYAFAPIVASKFWHVSGLGPLIRLGLLIGAFGALAHVPSIYFQSLKKFHVNSAVLTGQAIISFTGILVLAALRHWSVEAVILVSVVTAGVGASIFLVLVPKQALLVPTSYPSSAGQALRSLWSSPAIPVAADHDAVETPNEFAFYMLLSSVFVMLTLKADVWLMGFFLDTRSVGVYNAATRLTVPLAVLLAAMNTALWPRASSLVLMGDKIALLRKTLRLCSMVALAGIAYAIGVPMLAPLLFGARYAKSVSLGQLLCFRYLLAILACPVGVVGYSVGLVRVYWILNLLQLMAVVAINSLLLPAIGPVASTVALIVNEVFNVVGVGFLIWRKVSARA